MGYTVKTIHGCKVIFGQVPMDDFGALLKTMPEGAVMDIQAANHLGATFVAGMPGDTKKLLDLPPCEKLKKQAADARQNGLSEQASDWLLRGERGSSSEAMFAVLTGLSKGNERAYPSDPDDLRRCRLLLEHVPELAPRIGAMAKVPIAQPPTKRRHIVAPPCGQRMQFTNLERKTIMGILSLFGLTTEREAQVLAQQARANGRQEGIEVAGNYSPGRELIEFSRICRKFKFRIVTNSDDAQATENLRRLLGEQLGVNTSKAVELTGFIAPNVKTIEASDEQLFF